MFTYDDSASNWVLKDTLLPRDEGTNQQFGAMNCLSGDGQRVLVSAVDNISGNAAYVVIHEKDGDNWKLRQPSDRDVGVTGDFGLTTGAPNGYKYLGTGSLGEDKTLSLSRDGSTIIVCDPYITSGYSHEGRVRIFNMPSNIKSIWGSNDDVNWTKITTAPTREEATSNVAGFQFGYNDEIDITNIDNPNYYKYHAIVADAFTRLKDVKLFGVRNQGSSTLHDGALTLTKNLDVPRIGPPLDADDTPRRDRLVVEYNTHKNPMEDGLVQDTSGRGNDGAFYGGASYDATEKALEFSGGSRLQGYHNFLETTNSNCHSFSVNLWFNHNISNPYYNVIFHTGNTPPVSGSSPQMFINGNDQISVSKAGYDINTSVVPERGGWYHVVWTYPGGDVFSASKIYVNGVLETVTTSGSNAVLNKITGRDFALGHQLNASAGTAFTGHISNFKLYDTALTAEEVKTLYDMGRCDEGGHIVNFSKTRVGIGLGDGEAPQAALDVRGNVSFGSGSHELRGYFKYNNQPRFSAYSNNGNTNYSGFSSPIVMNSTFYNVGSHYSTSTGAFTAPVTGHYRFSIEAWNNGTGVHLSMWYRTSNSGAWDDIAPHKLLGLAPNGDEIIWTSLGASSATTTYDLYVPAGYQIGFGTRGGGAVTIYRAHTYFSGELISIV